MALITSGTALDRAYADFKTQARFVLQRSNEIKSASAAGTLNGRQILEFTANLRDSLAHFDAVMALPGLTSYVQLVENQPAYDVLAEFAPFRTALVNTINWIATNIPEDANGYKLVIQMANDHIQWRVFPAGATASLRAQLDALIASMN
jgi:hypothetical protein